LAQFIEYCKADLIDPALVSFIAVSSARSAAKVIPDIQAELDPHTTEPYVRRYQVDSSTSSVIAVPKPDASAVKTESIPSHDTPAMDVDSAPELPPQNGAQSPIDTKNDKQVTPEDDLFGDSTMVEPASAMSPPRY
jgi:hypothetical protein